MERYSELGEVSACGASSGVCEADEGDVVIEKEHPAGSRPEKSWRIKNVQGNGTGGRELREC